DGKGGKEQGSHESTFQLRSLHDLKGFTPSPFATPVAALRRQVPRDEGGERGDDVPPGDHGLNATTFCCCSPRPSMPRRTTSPACRYFGVGFMPMATPGGVPVTITSPGSSTMNCEQYQTRCAQSNTMVLVEPFCRLSPLTVSHMARFCGSLISSLFTSQGPSGPKVSQALPSTH